MRRRFLFLAVASTTAAGGLVAMACGSTSPTERPPVPDSSFAVDGGIVEPPDGSGSDAAPPAPKPSCDAYCDLVTATCKGEHMQYANKAECLAVCALLPLGQGGEKDTSSVGCRQVYADSPARTDSVKYCAAAGPFGGNLCGDRCTAFCQLTLAACAPDAGKPPFKSNADCQAACAELPFTDAGGEGLDGPVDGNTLNCRLYHLRTAIKDANYCVNLAPDSGMCR